MFVQLTNLKHLLFGQFRVAAGLAVGVTFELLAVLYVLVVSQVSQIDGPVVRPIVVEVGDFASGRAGSEEGGSDETMDVQSFAPTVFSEHDTFVPAPVIAHFENFTDNTPGLLADVTNSSEVGNFVISDIVFNRSPLFVVTHACSGSRQNNHKYRYNCGYFART